MILFACAHFSLCAMKPHGLRRVQRCFEQLSAHIRRPGHVHVFMNDAKVVTLSSCAEKPITISTAGLIGCTATVLYAKDAAARQYALLMHYHPANHPDHLVELEQQIKLLMNSAKPFKSVKFLSVQPESKHAAQEYYKRRSELEEVVRKTSMHSPIGMLHTTYDLPPAGKGYFAEVHVTLANNVPSTARVMHWADGYNCELE